MRPVRPQVAAVTLMLALSACGLRNTEKKLAREVESALTGLFLEVWYPRAVDTECGGFLSTFTFDFHPTGPQDKAVITQARHTWTTSQAAVRFPGNPVYRQAAEHGFRFLKERMWDSSHGGFYQKLDRCGNPEDSDYRGEKRAYGNAFGIFACVAYYRMSGDTAALNLARRAFLWLDSKAHDAGNLGYFQNLKADGTPLRMGDTRAAGGDRATAGLKDYNSSIHILEAFTALYEVWPDTSLRRRLDEMFHVIRDTIVNPAGTMQLYFTPAWRPISFRDSSESSRKAHFHLDHVSFGHDIETAFLLIEASEALGKRGDPATLTVARRMVDHSLRTGWDPVNGGVFYEGYYFPGADTITIINDKKDWWVQAETLHVLLLMSRLFPENPIYFRYFLEEWNYIKNHIIDRKFGGWFEGGIDNHPEYGQSLKGQEWKATYHETRSMLNCLKLLDPQYIPEIRD